MARTTFGNTWWGAQWLHALSHIDFDNRLPRGRTYANRGAVLGLEVRGGGVTAKVQGSRPSPYKVAITVPAMPKAEAGKLLDAIAGEPTLIARLLNGELDPAVLDLAKSLGIAVFPARWQDLSMQCSCPDWAVPCKHLAAAIYLLSREIDGNPFLVFSLRGVDLVAALKGRGVDIAREARTVLPTLAELVDARAVLAEMATDDKCESDDLDYTTIPDLTTTLPLILQARPACYAAGDLRDVLQRMLARVAKAARREIDRSGPDSEAAMLSPDDWPTLLLDECGVATVAGIRDVRTLAALDTALSRLQAVQLADVQPQAAALFHVRLAALHLLAKGAVVPQVFAAPGDTIAVRWLPAALDANVRELMARLESTLPAGLVDVVGAGPAGSGRQAKTLCGIFLGRFIRDWAPSDGQLPADKILALLYGGGPVRFDGAGEGAHAANLQGWLSRLHLARRELSPVLCLAEDGEDVTLQLAVEGAGIEPVPLDAVLREPAWAGKRFGVLQTVAMLAEFYPPLDGYVRAGAITPLRLGGDALAGVLFDALPPMRLLGIRMLLPRALERVWRPRASMKLAAQSNSSGLLDTNSLFRFDWQIAVGDAMLSWDEFERLVTDAHGVVRFRGQYVYLDPREIERLRRQLAKPPALSGTELLRTALAGEYEGAPIALDDNARALIRELTTIADLPAPAGLKAQLRPYQQRGYAWLYRNLRAGLGSVLADDMGLGKTLQVIAMLARLHEEGALADSKALVVVPTSLLTNWQKEIARFAPHLSVGVFHGTKRELAQEDRPDVLLTTYGIARSAQAALKALAWRVVVIDEAQAIKNPVAAQTKAVKSLPAAAFVAMSGTPVENRLAEYWSIMDFANRGYLGGLTHFEREYAKPIEVDRDHAAARRFQQVTAPFLMRRLKSDRTIIDDLPHKIELDQYCELTESQAALYESVVREGLAAAHGESDAFKRLGLVLQMILALKQVCNHPAHYLKQGGADAAASGKVGRFFELLDDIHASHDKAIVFTQFREMGDLLQRWLGERYGRAPAFLHGSVSRAKRDEMVDRFQTDRTERVFLLSLKAGGTGLNLTAASHVIHFDLWWNPAVEAQATDRAYRIGQQRNVQVHRLITSATFEERINDLIKSKRELADMAVGTGENWIGDLGDAELKALFSLKP